MNRFVYLDNNATTKISKHIQEKILPFIDLQFGNPSSIYGHGKKIRAEIENARRCCAELINSKPENIIFTSGGSEGNSSAINSAINQYPKRKKIITTKVEHSSILEYCKMLEQRGYDVVYLDVDKDCNLKTEQLVKEIDDNTCLVSIQFANNEVGTILLTEEVLKKISLLKNKYNFLFHVDCVQGLGKSLIDVASLGADFITFSGHKIHCPKGVGFLYIKSPSTFVPLIAGHQEFGLRGGTENVLGIIALGESCRVIKEDFISIQSKIIDTNHYLEDQLCALKKLKINAKKAKRIPNTTSVAFEELEGNQLLLRLEQRGICVSTGSACNSVSSEPSYVLVAMKLAKPQNTIRISIDENTTNSQIDYFISNLSNILKGE